MQKAAVILADLPKLTHCSRLGDDGSGTALLKSSNLGTVEAQPANAGEKSARMFRPAKKGTVKKHSLEFLPMGVRPAPTHPVMEFLR